MAALAISSCSEPNAASSYQIAGNVTSSDLEGSKIYLTEYSGKEKLDSATVVGGKFKMSGELGHPKILAIIANSSGAFLTTGETATITIDQEITVEQGVESATIKEMSESLNALNGAFKEFYNANRNDEEAIEAEWEKVAAKMTAIEDSYLAANPDNLVGAFAVIKKVRSSDKDLETLDSLIALAPLSAEQYLVKTIRNSKIQSLKTAVGEKFIDFDGTDMDDNPLKLSDYVGKGNYVLVDFWASWCGPCRAEMPNLKSIYDKHKDNGLVLIGINVWDNKEACITAMEEESMTWPIIYASHDTSATEKYGIQGIPTIILFGPDGTVVNRTARGPQIVELIDSIYTK